MRYLPADRYTADIRVVNDGDADFPISALPVRAGLRRLVQRRGMAWYKLSDLTAEIRAAAAASRGRIDLLHYLDGEHSAQYFPRVRRLLRTGRTRVIATYHQPAALLPQLVRRDVVQRLDAVTLVSETQRPFFHGLLPEDRIFVIPHGIDTEAFRPPAARTDEAFFRCISVGHYLRDYEAVAAVAKRFLDDESIRFDIV
ncbi:MAG TPA: glycosyltransferase, partial [Candidatus Limnocylindrales bacterium]|nr:glycosyltransferase [Candidatus Limnocylindrales bacterium]